jgi:hypothetical protein
VTVIIVVDLVWSPACFVVLFVLVLFAGSGLLDLLLPSGVVDDECVRGYSRLGLIAHDLSMTREQ